MHTHKYRTVAGKFALQGTKLKLEIVRRSEYGDHGCPCHLEYSSSCAVYVPLSLADAVRILISACTARQFETSQSHRQTFKTPCT